MNVLVATPARKGTPNRLLKLSQRIYDSLTWLDRERAVCRSEYPPATQLCGNNARARNELVETYLLPEHTHILWLDVDLVSVPSDIIELLAEISENDIVAPFVLMEPNEWFGSDRFYDVGGFRQNGKDFSLFPLYCGGGDLVELDSVGSCYLIPAEVYRWGARYSPVGDEVEHPSLMKAAREMEFKVYARRDVIVRHAFLPYYGVDLH